jgi:hypothetical protein
MPPNYMGLVVAGERLSANSGNSAKKGPHVPAPFPWSTEYRAKNHSLEWILRRGLTSIGGEVQCKRCDGMTTVEVNLQVHIQHFMCVLRVDLHLEIMIVEINVYLVRCFFVVDNSCHESC